jgi:diguanylate cyclase (GGDEF)-like protein
VKLEGTFLRSKVARRVLLSFVLAAFIPFLSLAILYFVQANRMLVRQAHASLQTASASYGRTIYDRLLIADGLLRDAAGDLSGHDAHAAATKRLGKVFRGLAVTSPQHGAVPLFPDTPMPLGGAADAQLRRGGSVLMSGDSPGRGARILLVQALRPVVAELRLVVAEIDAGYLWGDPEAFPYMTFFCVLNEAYAGLYCPQPFHAEAIGVLIRDSAQSTKGEFAWQGGREKFLADFQEVFLEPKFFAPRWIVVAAQPEGVALDPIATFSAIFWAGVVLSILLVALLSLTQIRRIMVPLEQLIDGTRRLGGKHFATKVEVASRDEFGELAGSFNVMAARLGRQFDTLTTLSKIDRAILSELDMDRIVEGVLRRLKEDFKAACASISVLDHDSPEKVRVHALAEDGARSPVKRCALPADAREALRAIPDGLWMSFDTARRTMQGCLESLSAQHFFTLPIIWKDRLVGVVCLGYPASAVLSEEDIGYIRDYADRVGVALSTVAREGQLYQQARTDALSGLPNRFHFLDRLTQDIALAQREGRNLAVLFIDLDRFKVINDSLGHAAGDELLREAASRLRQCVRESDTVARLGGDEFTILVHPLLSAKAAGTVAEHVIAALSKPFLIEKVENFVTASIGIAVYPSDGATAEDLMRNADTAMYGAKDGGRGRYVFFEEAMNAEVVKRSTLERELRHAISEQQFILHYQPQVDPRTGRVRGVEALVRWRHPERGVVAPGQFIVAAEETGLITGIGHIVLVEACAQFRAWRDHGIGLEYVSVNVSNRQFREENFVDTVEASLRTNAMPAECLELEITESILIDGAGTVVNMLARLKSLGVRIAIDDFGTGYSSMSYLEQLPFDTLKIDMSFVRKIRDDGEGGTIVAMIVAMAHALGKNVVAEGAETQAQIDFLCKHDCELVQGYYYSRPLPAAELAAFLSNRQVLETDLV